MEIWGKIKAVGFWPIAIVVAAVAIVLFLAMPRARAEGISKAGLVPIGEVAAATTKWSGFYIGPSAGWANADIDFPGAPAHPAGPPRQTLEGAVLGGQIGYNWQINGLVLGVEADASWGDLGGTVKDGNYMTETQSIDWMGSVRGRVGYAFGSLLPYLTAGIMWDRASAGVACPSGAEYGFCKSGAFDFSDKQVHQGFVWGGGVEHAIASRMSVRVEALYADMGDETYTLGGSPWKVEHELTIVRAGINLKLN